MGALGLYNGFAVPMKQITADPNNATNAADQAIAVSEGVEGGGKGQYTLMS